MTRIYRIENLDCANCAAKIEAKINGLPQVEEATLTFATGQLRVRGEDPDALLPKMLSLARTVEPDVRILLRDEAPGHDHHYDHEGCNCGHDHHHDHESCNCGHDHHHDHESCNCGHDHHHGHDHESCGCGHDYHPHHRESYGQASHGNRDLLELVWGGGLFLVGLLLNHWATGWIAGVPFVAAWLILGWEVLRKAGKNLTRGHVMDENFLMSLATLGAFAMGEFPEAVGVMLFYRVGEYFEHRAVARSRSQIMEAVDLRPETVNRLRGDRVEVIDARQAQVGDLLLVRPGDRIPLDGRVISGESRLDTAPITGEPVPVGVRPGDEVISGCVNTAAQLTIRVERVLAESMVTRILNSVESAAASKPQVERFITRFARVYTPVVVSLAVAVALIPGFLTGQWRDWVYTALTFLVMSCPCALVLSVPLAFFSGIGKGSKQGILFKGGASMEALASVKAVALDKTGTLTKGDFQVQEVVGDEEMLALCASVEQHSTHPIAQRVTAYARERGLTLTVPETLEELPGRGLRGVVRGKTVLCGNEKLLAEAGLAWDPSVGQGSLVYVAVDGTLRGYLRISDTLKPGSKAAMERLKALGVSRALVTGDRREAAQAAARETGISRVYAQLLPQEKLEVIQTLRREQGGVMFVGDGINDAPVLAGADVGAAMGTGADAAIEAADVVFMTGQVQAIPQALEIARRTRRIAWQNVVFALGVKAAVMVLGLLGHASMWMAVFADSGVAMLCVLNSIRLLYSRK